MACFASLTLSSRLIFFIRMTEPILPPLRPRIEAASESASRSLDSGDFFLLRVFSISPRRRFRFRNVKSPSSRFWAILAHFLPLLLFRSDDSRTVTEFRCVQKCVENKFQPLSARLATGGTGFPPCRRPSLQSLRCLDKGHRLAPGRAGRTAPVPTSRKTSRRVFLPFRRSPPRGRGGKEMRRARNSSAALSRHAQARHAPDGLSPGLRLRRATSAARRHSGPALPSPSSTRHRRLVRPSRCPTSRRSR